MNPTGGTELDIPSRIKKAQQAFSIPRPVWRSKALMLPTKIRLFNSNVKAVLINGSETWKMTKILLNKIQVFINRCLRYILRIRWSDRTTNEEIWERTKQENIETQIRRRKLKRVGHTMRKDTKKYHQSCPPVEPPRATKERKTRNHMEKNKQGKGRVQGTLR